MSECDAGYFFLRLQSTQASCLGPANAVLVQELHPGPRHQCSICRNDAVGSGGPATQAEASGATLLHQPSLTGAGVFLGGREGGHFRARWGGLGGPGWEWSWGAAIRLH